MTYVHVKALGSRIETEAELKLLLEVARNLERHDGMQSFICAGMQGTCKGVEILQYRHDSFWARMSQFRDSPCF